MKESSDTTKIHQEAEKTIREWLSRTLTFSLENIVVTSEIGELAYNRIEGVKSGYSEIIKTVRSIFGTIDEIQKHILGFQNVDLEKLIVIKKGKPYELSALGYRSLDISEIADILIDLKKNKEE